MVNHSDDYIKKLNSVQSVIISVRFMLMFLHHLDLHFLNEISHNVYNFYRFPA